MPGADKIDSLGKPNLPFYYYNFIIPNNMDVTSVQITSSTSETIEGEYYIYPAQHPIPTLAESEPPPFVEPDSTTYQSSELYPGIVAECIGMGFFDGANKIAKIAIYPLQYKPSNRELSLHTLISINLQFTSSSNIPVYPEIRTDWGIKIYEHALESIVVNQEDIPTYGYIPQIDNNPYHIDDIYYYPYTIITTEDMASYYSDFVEWESMKGIPAGVVTVEDIVFNYPNGDLINTYPIDDDAGSIRQYLRDGWEHFGIIFVLLGGDENSVPVRIYGYTGGDISIATDVYFSDLNGDWEVDGGGYYGEYQQDAVDFLPEIYIGRLTSDNQFRVNWWFNKLKKYETLPSSREHLFNMIWTQSDFAQNANYAQSFSNSTWWPDFINDIIIEEIPEYNSNPVQGPFGTDIIEEINNGCGWINHYNHGTTRMIVVATNGNNGMIQYLISSLDSYNNGHPNDSYESMLNPYDEFPIMYTTSCQGAYFNYQYNYVTPVEAFTCWIPQGGPAAIGSTYLSWWGSARDLHSWFFKMVWEYGSSNIGTAHFVAKWLSINYASVNTYDMAMRFILFGSPEMNIWITTPQEFTNISHPLSIPESGNPEFEINTGVSDATVCIYQEDEGFYDFGLTDENGDIIFDIEFIDNSNQRLWITANRYDYSPYQYSMIPGVPGPPQDVQLVVIEPNLHPVLTWNGNPEPDIIGYNIFKKLILPDSSIVPYTLQNDEPINDTTWTDTSFIAFQGGAETVYYFIVTV